MRIGSTGHAVFAATLIVVGILGLLHSDYVVVWSGLSKAFPARDALLYLCAVVALVAGIGLFWRRTSVAAARLLLAWLVLWTLLSKARFIALGPLVEGTYQSLGENMVLIAGAWVLYAWFAGEWDERHLAFATGARGVRIARVIYALAMLAFGLSHFFYLNLTAPLVPAWLPWHVGWAYFTGTAYLAAGVAMLIGVWSRLAVVLSVIQMGGFTLLIWLPMAIAGTLSTFQHGEFLESWALTAAAWVVADSYRGASWLAVGRR